MFSRLAADGHVLADPRLLPISGNPTIVWTGSEYGIAWGDIQIHFLRLDLAGQPIAPPTVLSDPCESMSSPDLVWTGTGYALVWVAAGNFSPPCFRPDVRILFTRLDPLGAPVGTPLVLRSGYHMGSPRLAWAGDGYGVVWENMQTGPFTSPRKIYFLRLAADGSNGGTPLNVGTPPGDADAPEIAWSGTHFGVTWQDPYGKHLTLVDAAGATQGSNALIGPSSFPRQTPLAWTGSEFMAAWTQGGPGTAPSFIRVRRFDTDGQPIGNAIPLINDSSQPANDVRLAWNGSGFGLVWRDSPFPFEATQATFGRLSCSCFEDSDGDSWTVCEGDCDDSRADTYPGATEFCDGLDQNCDAVIDDGLSTLVSCGVGACRRGVPYCAAGVVQTCIPGIPTVEVCNGIDDDCDEGVDDVDADQDAWVLCADCNDSDASIHPFAEEICNAVDDDCDGLVDNQADAIDSDFDGIAGACDNCPTLPNRDQTDSEADGEGDVCDYDDGLPLLWPFSSAGMDWHPDPAFVTFDLYRGDIDVLRATGNYTQDAGASPFAYRLCGLDGFSYADDSPPVGKAFFYLLVTHTVTGETLGLGNDSSGNARPNTLPCE